MLIRKNKKRTADEQRVKLNPTFHQSLFLPETTTCQDCIGAAHIQSEDHKEFQEIIPSNNLHHKPHSFSTSSCLICMEALNNQESLYHSKCAKSLFDFSHAPIIDISIQDLEKLALLQINQRLTLTGVQKKLSLSPIIENKKERLTVVGLDGRFILKPSTEDFPEMAEIEHLSMKMAEKQGIPTALCGLVYLSSGERAYITRRFDRIQHEKIQVEDFCQLSEKSTSQKIPVLAKVLVKSLITILINPKMTNLLCFRCSCFLFG